MRTFILFNAGLFLAAPLMAEFPDATILFTKESVCRIADYESEPKVIAKESLGVIVTAEYVEKNPGKFPTAGGFDFAWTPSMEQVLQAYFALGGYFQSVASSVSSNTPGVKAIQHDWREQRFQYSGLTKGSRQILRIHCFPGLSPRWKDYYPRWKEQLIEVYDGGSSFWRVDYDIRTGEFSNLEFNEVA